MKQLSLFLCVTGLAIILTSCGGAENVLPRKDGTWVVSTQIVREYIANTLDTTYTETNVGTAVFNKDGSGTWSDADTTYATTWSADDKAETVTWCQDYAGTTFCVTYDVLESSGKQQKWSTMYNSGSGNYQEVEVTLDRK